MTGPNWPRRRYELIVKKGGTPLGIKLHQTKIRRGVYANGFAEGAYPPPGPQACMRVGDILVSVDGKDVLGASLPTALVAIEAARRRDRLRDFITAKQDDHRKGTVILVFERLAPNLTFRDVALDPRKVVYLLNYMLEVRRSTSSKEEVSLDEARLMFWLEVQALFEMSVVMTPSREDMSKVYDKFFRQGSGFYVHELAIKPQIKKGSRKSWDGQLSTTSTPPAVDLKPLTGKDAVEATVHQEQGSPHLVEEAAAAGFVDPAGGADGEEGGAGRSGSAMVSPASLGPDVRAFDGGGSLTEWLSSIEAGGGRAGDEDEGGGGSEMPDDLLAGDLSKMFRASQEKVEATLTAGAFFRFKTRPWFGRMVAHLSNSPDFVHVAFEKIMAEQELRDVMMLHMVIGQVPGWLQVWREVEMSVKPRLAVLQTRRSVRQRPQAVGNSSQRHRRCTFPGSGEYGRGGNGGGRGDSEGGPGGVSLSGTAEAKADAAVAIVASAVYLWDFFLSADSHASLGLARNTTAYTTLQELMVGSSAATTVGAGAGVAAYAGVGKWESTAYGLGGGKGASVERVAVTAVAKVAALSAQGGDAGVDLAVSVGKALLDMQRQALRKLCAGIYPDFLASSTYEHLCEELTAGSRSLRRPPAVGLPYTAVPGAPVSPPFSDIALDPASPSPRWVSADGAGSASGEVLLSPAPAAPWPPQAPAHLSPRHEGSGAGVFDGPGKERPRSPFIFVGGGEFSTRNGDGSPRRNSAPPGDIGGDPWSGALAYRSGGQGQETSSVEVLAGLSGPDFEELWNGSRGWVLEKVMRKIELPSHVSRHRPPFGGTRAREAVRRLSRCGSGTSLGSASASPELLQHLCLPYKTRRFGRRPYPIVDGALRRKSSGSAPSPGSPLDPTEDFHTAGGSNSQAGGSQTGELELASPPGVFTRLLYADGEYGVGEDESRSDFRRGVSGDVVTRWCAEWAVSFSGWLDQGVTKVKTEHAVSVDSRDGSSTAVPDGLEAFFWPELPADGRGPCACCPLPCLPSYPGAAGGVRKGKSRSRNRRLFYEFCSHGERPPAPPPRLITFAAPGRNGVGTFYGVCLSVYRLVPQCVGELPASPLVFDGHNSSPSTVSPATTMATVVSAVPAVRLSDAAPFVSSGDLCAADGSARDLSTGVASGEAPAEANASASGSMTEGELAVTEELRVSTDVEAGDSEGNAGGETTTRETETVTMTSMVETTISSSLIDLSRFRRGMGIFGKAPLGQSKVTPGTAVATRVDGSAGVGSGSGGSTSTTTKADTGGQRWDKPEAITVPSEEALEPVMGGIAVVEDAVDGRVFPTSSGGASEGPGIKLEVSRDDEAACTHVDEHQDARKQPPMAPLDTPSRFKMSIGMFGSGKSPAGHRKGWGSGSAAPASSAPAAASAGTGKASKTASTSPTTMAATPASAAGGGGGGSGRKFSSYARRAGNFIGSSESRNNVGRSHKLNTSASSPDVLANGPPAPTPGIPTYLASRGVEPSLRTSLPSPEVGKIGENAAAAAPREASEAGLVEASGARGEVGTAAGTSAATTISDAGGMKGRSMSSTTSDSGGFGGSLSDSPKGVRDGSDGVAASAASGYHGGGNGEGGRQQHLYYVPSGVCLLSTRPAIGAMRRSLAAYWRAHADDITASVMAAGGEATEGDDLGGFQDAEATLPATSAGAWTRFTADELRDALNPFVVRHEHQKRQEQWHHDRQSHRHQRQVSEAVGAVTTVNVLPKSFSAGDMSATADLAAGRSGLIEGDGGDFRGGEATLKAEPNVRVQRHPPAPSGAEHADGLGSVLDFDPSVVFRCLSPRHLCLVVTALLCERKVVMVSSRLSLLTMAGEVFRSLLQPLSWSHVYVPLLPRRMAGDLLQCPTPYLLGLDSETAAGLELPKDAVRVYLDVDVLLAPKDFVGLAPMSVLCARLSSVWNPGVDDLDYPFGEEGAGAGDPTAAGAFGGAWSAGTADGIRFLFREFVSELLQGAAECTFEVGQGSTLTVLLDERLYKHSKAAAAKETERFYEERRLSPWGRKRGREAALSNGAGPLYNRHCGVLLDQFVKTQMFSQFLSEGT